MKHPSLLLSSRPRRCLCAFRCCVLLCLLCFCSTLSGLAQRHTGLFHSQSQNAVRFRAMEWNVENLYDTLHDEGFADEEFLPTAERRWNTPRYLHKQASLAKTILAAGGLQPVDLVALCEVENDSVVHFLCHRTRLARLGYHYMVTHSADRRGIDVALLYQPETYAYLHSETRRVPYDAARERPTRDLLHVAGRLPHGDTLDVFVVHFPSRRGGAAASEPYRLRAAQLLREMADSIAHLRHRPLLLAMGDFNDEPQNRSIREVLSPTFIALTPHATPLPAEGHEDIAGTYYFRGEWSRIDQMLVSPALLSSEMPFHTSIRSVYLLAFPPLLEPLGCGTLTKPFRSYLGPFYHGGISDHLPLVADFFY